jgi:alpha-amylase/alpha-mannosidase (GH57 family)
MQVWHLAADAPRSPNRVAPGDLVELVIGTWPIAPGQHVAVEVEVTAAGEIGRWERLRARWMTNRGGSSYWRAMLGPYTRGDRVTYRIVAGDGDGSYALPAETFVVGPRAHLALLWHQHQPLYRSLTSRDPRGSIRLPWVRLHTLRDYVAMPMLVTAEPGARATFNLSPSLLLQVQHYLDGATDRALELTRADAAALDDAERRELMATFFDADWRNQIEPHPRYRALFEARRAGTDFEVQDLRDLQMWANLAWFAVEYRQGAVALPTGQTVSVQHFVEQGAGFDRDDLEEMIGEQYKLLAAVVAAHADAAATRRVELSTNPFFHPILPLLIDTDAATIDRPGAARPLRFAHPADAEAQLSSALAAHARWFGAAPRGLWPSEGAISPAALAMLARQRLTWIATDEGVLARSGRWGYDVTRPEVLYTPYRVEQGDAEVAVFFRDRQLSDAIGFALQRDPDPERAADAWVAMLRARVHTLPASGDHVVTVILDGENPWGGYLDDGHPFLRALYRRLASAADLEMVTFAEWIDGAPDRGLVPHPVAGLPTVHDVFAGSWIDEAGSNPGVDHGTWIGEPEENEAWALLAATHRWLAARSAPAAAIEALHAAEGSDWTWWRGADQDSGQDPAFDALFRDHLASVYRLCGAEAPTDLWSEPSVRTVTWEVTSPSPTLRVGDRLAVRTHCAGRLAWWIDPGSPTDVELVAAGGAMSGPGRRQTILGPFIRPGIMHVRMTCEHRGNDHVCCGAGTTDIPIEER